MRVRRRDLQNLDASVLHVAQEPRAIGARRLDAYATELPEGAHPGEHLLIAVPRRRKTSASQHPVELIDDGSNVKIFVRVDATDDAPVRPRLTNFHAGSPGSQGIGGSTGPNAWTRQ